MGKYSVEDTTLQAIGNKIREKTKGVNTIDPLNMPSEIDAVFEAGKEAEYDAFWDDFQENGNKTNYFHAFGGNGWTAKTLVPKYVIKPISTTDTSTEAQSIFSYLGARKAMLNMTEICKKLDLSQAINCTGLFLNAWATNITVDLSNVVNVTQVFGGADGGRLDEITVKITENTTTGLDKMFWYCQYVGNLAFAEGSVIPLTISFQHSYMLTVQSAKNVIYALKNYAGTDKEFVYTITFHAYVWEKLDADQTAPGGLTWRQYVNSIGWNI